jgi:hypothetical protein
VVFLHLLCFLLDFHHRCLHPGNFLLLVDVEKDVMKNAFDGLVQKVRNLDQSVTVLVVASTLTDRLILVGNAQTDRRGSGRGRHRSGFDWR